MDRSLSKDLDRWAYWNHVEVNFSRPATPSDNALVEAFNSRFRQEFLNEHWFLSMEDAREKIAAWQIEYNTGDPTVHWGTAHHLRSPTEAQRQPQHKTIPSTNSWNTSRRPGQCPGVRGSLMGSGAQQSYDLQTGRISQGFENCTNENLLVYVDIR